MTEPIVKFTTDAADNALIRQIADRALVLFADCDLHPKRLHMEMDISACHAQCPLDLAALLKAEDVDFMHDITGIGRHLNRRTGRLENCFWPRYAKPVADTSTEEV